MPAEKCTLCDGAGELNGKCMVCSGQKIAREHAFSEHFIRCRVCDGTGTLVQVECHSCDGKGERETIEAAYPMSVEVIKDFTEFCKKSGGFSIY